MTAHNKFIISETAENGSYIKGYSEAKGTINIRAEFNSVRTDDKRLISFNPLHAEADLIVYDPLVINPSEIRIPWDPIESFKYRIILKPFLEALFKDKPISKQFVVLITD